MSGDTRLTRLLTLLLVWTAALALPLVSAPWAHAMAEGPPCSMEASGMSDADHAIMDCCDHGAGKSVEGQEAMGGRMSLSGGRD